MSLKDQKRFKRFTCLGLLRFTGALDDDVYEFLIDCYEKLHNLCLIESHGVLILLIS